jgi:hypothetical protein
MTDQHANENDRLRDCLAEIDPETNPERARFEAWYVAHAFHYEANPIGSRECSLQWQAWNAAILALSAREAAPVATFARIERDIVPIHVGEKGARIVALCKQMGYDNETTALMTFTEMVLASDPPATQPPADQRQEGRHAWRPDADIEGAVYCGRCDCTRRIADGAELEWTGCEPAAPASGDGLVRRYHVRLSRDDQAWGYHLQPAADGALCKYSEVRQVLLAAALTTPPAPAGAVLLEAGFQYRGGVNIPTLLIGFDAEDWDARTRFAAALAQPAQPDQGDGNG